MKKIKVNILGTEYSFIETTESEDVDLKDNFGVCDSEDKIIKVDTHYSDETPVGKIRFNQTKRHEILHAFFDESGVRLSGMIGSHDSETIINWIAMQFPKLLKAFQEVNAVE